MLLFCFHLRQWDDVANYQAETLHAGKLGKSTGYQKRSNCGRYFTDEFGTAAAVGDDRPPNLSDFGGKFLFFFIIYDFPPLSIIFRKNEIIDKCACTCLQRKMAAYKLKLDSAGYDRIYSAACMPRRIILVRNECPRRDDTVSQ